MAHTICSSYQIMETQEAEKEGNVISGRYEFTDSKVVFHGKNNRVIFAGGEKPCQLKDTSIIFWGDNSIAYIGINNPYMPHMIDLQFSGENYCYIGSETIFGGFSMPIRITCSQGVNVFIGGDNLIGDGVRIMTTDGHPLYNKDGVLKNPPQSIYIGDHVWIGVETLLLKGTKIGSGATVGAKSVLHKDIVESNSIWAGIPAQLIEENVVHSNDLLDANTQKNITADQRAHYEYKKDEYTIEFEGIAKEIRDSKTVEDKKIYLDKMYEKALNSKYKNQFYVQKNNE